MACSSSADELPFKVRCLQDERRAQPRLRCKGTAEVRILRFGSSVAGTIVDLSVGGCCVVTEGKFPPVEQPLVEVILSVNGSKLRMAGVVRNVKKDQRAGIEFIEVTRRKAQQIREFVRELRER